MDKSNWRDGLFEEFERLVEIEVCSSRQFVPENNKLLRCFQFISMDRVSLGDYCWNGDCTNCQFWYESDGQVKSALACRTYVKPGMVITGLSACLHNDLSAQATKTGAKKRKPAR
ncbi:MAG TPA: hypothetical protein VKM94_01370 [Blastocatellia bacterium]|nr:hypothetical protein [Blastocatellia bacterium]